MFTNTKKIPLPLAVMLATDTYDYINKPKTISATTLLKSTKSIILSSKIPEVKADIASYVPSRMGTALHDGMEAAWKHPIEPLKKLGYSDDVITKIIDDITFEVRSSKEVNGYTVTGKYDCVMDGVVHDLKSTSVWGWVFGDTDKFVKQLSIYKWLNPDVITEDIGKIMYWFTDWSAKAALKSDYPQFRILEKALTLDLNIEDFIIGKLAEIDTAIATGNAPDCTAKELWRKPDTWAYYANPNNLVRATKVFNDSSLAHEWKGSKGKGTTIHRPGSVGACNYCNARDICSQAESYIFTGELTCENI